MQIDLPANIVDQANRLAASGEDAAVVIGRALEEMEHRQKEIAAIKEGIDAYRAGDHEPWDDFAGRLMAERGISREK